MCVRAALTCLLASATLATCARAALADGDPASDVLANQAVFIPRDAGLSAGAQQRLEAVVAGAGGAGYPIRVALIASRSDLGSVTALWQQPATYARYLGEELSLLYHGPVLVVMPQGVGFEARAGAGAPSLPSGLGATSRGAQLAGIAVRAVERLAAAAGHPLRVRSLRTVSGHGGESGPAPWIAFIVGLWMIALSWWASLRARPVRLRQRSAGRVA